MSYSITTFSDKVRVMNQTNSKSLTLNADEARNLESDIMSLMAKVIYLSEKSVNNATQVQIPSNIEVDGGNF